jgi:RNA polymerase-binding transcription factor DksA
MEIDPEQARGRVEAERERVQGLVRHLRDELDDETAGEQSELADYDQHPADSGSETFEREKDLSILEQLEAELAELQAALERIDAGTYGIDEVTGRPIPAERLDAMPAARTNVDTDTGRRG